MQETPPDVGQRLPAVTTEDEVAAPQVGILDALPGRVALLDADGIILWVNKEWRRTAEAEGMPRESYVVGAS